MLIVIIKTVKMCAILLIGLGFSPFACLVQPPNSVKGVGVGGGGAVGRTSCLWKGRGTSRLGAQMQIGAKLHYTWISLINFEWEGLADSSASYLNYNIICYGYIRTFHRKTEQHDLKIIWGQLGFISCKFLIFRIIFNPDPKTKDPDMPTLIRKWQF